jgi:hypothetical protein
VRGLRGGGRAEGGGVRSGPGVARTILLFHTISARPSKQMGREVKGGKGFRARVGNMSSGTCMREEGAKSACGPKPND